MVWSLVVRAGNMSVKGMDNVWKALIRPHLEYGAEVMSSSEDSLWEEAEVVMRTNGRRILKCGSRVPNEAVMGELGWMSMRGRRMLLRLSFWGKVLQMKEVRLVKRVYEAGRQRLFLDPKAGTWCNLSWGCRIRGRGRRWRGTGERRPRGGSWRLSGCGGGLAQARMRGWRTMCSGRTVSAGNMKDIWASVA